MDILKLLLDNKNIEKELIDNQKKIINENSAADFVKYIKEKYMKKESNNLLF